MAPPWIVIVTPSLISVVPLTVVTQPPPGQTWFVVIVPLTVVPQVMVDPNPVQGVSSGGMPAASCSDATRSWLLIVPSATRSPHCIEPAAPHCDATQPGPTLPVEQPPP